MNIQIINSEMFHRIVDSNYIKGGWQSKYDYEGLYIFRDGNLFIAVDNSTGDAWTEEFKDKETAIKWLKGELDLDDIY